jgi:hypothetical protein
MLHRLLLLTVLIVASAYAHAQDTAIVHGGVADSAGKPIELVNAVVKEDQNYMATTNEQGYYRLKVPAGKKITIAFTYLGKQLYSKVVTPKKNDDIQVSFQVEAPVATLAEVVVRDQSNRQEDITNIKVADILLPDAGGGGIEAYLAAQALGINKSNELSANYSVRGGSYDENLVYVNDFEIYRPYLMRSGQQEGLSFANPDLVSNIKFSSGGFQAKYGDKLSSVMDVTYKRPLAWGGSVTASLLGVSAHVEGVSKDPRRFTFLLGFRQKDSQYLLNSLDTKGQYSPNFLDLQFFATLMIDEKWSMEVISNYSRNQFIFQPVSQTTQFGAVNDVLQLDILFQGQEIDNYQSVTNGLSFIYKPKDNLRIKFMASVYDDQEKEDYNLISNYSIGQVQSDPGQSNYGQIASYQGEGGLQDWARNTLYIDVYTAATRGSWFVKHHDVQWGVDYKHEVINSQLSEWDMVDSAGYSLPYNTATGQKSWYGSPAPIGNNAQINIDNGVMSNFNLNSNRVSAFLQDTWRFGDSSRFSFNYGARFQYWDVNREPVATPRIQLSARPNLKKDIILTLSGGLYYQPPFYREMLEPDGTVNTHLKSQKSAQIVAGFNYAFKAWNRPFNFVMEAYYKYLWDVVSFDYDNTLIVYSGQNDAKGYAAGLDMRLNGELSEGTESWISLGLLNTQNIIAGSNKTTYLDSTGHQVSYVNATTAPTIKDTVVKAVGYQPRPTDQLVTVNVFFSDHLPKWPFIKFNMLLAFGSGIPVKAPDATYYSNDFRLPFYKRVDMGFAGQLWDPKWAKKKTKASRAFKSVWLSVDVLNIFGIQNVVSYLWIKDFYNNQYAVPNYLTGRRVNVKVVFNFGS